jgi:hypothetical protein
MAAKPKVDSKESSAGKTADYSRRFGGSKSKEWNFALTYQVLNSMWVEGLDEETLNSRINGAIGAMMCIRPKDELEGMIAAQLIASHNAAMECYRRAMLPNQTFEGRKENLNQANKLSRTHAALLEALNRHRGKGQQKVTVEHVHVHAGGQAVVGVVEGGGGRVKLKDQSHEKAVTNSSDPMLRGQDTVGDTMPVVSHEERAVPDARGNKSRRAKRK